MILQNGFLKIAAASGGSIKNDFYNFFFVVVNRARIFALVPYIKRISCIAIQSKKYRDVFFFPYRSALCHSPVTASTHFLFLFPTSLSAGKCEKVIL